MITKPKGVLKCMQKTIKIDDNVYDLLVKMKSESDFSFSKLIKYSLSAFKSSKDYALMVLYNQEPEEIKENKK